MLFGGTAVVALLALFAMVLRKGRSEDEARAYLAGVTYVLSDDPDAAIAELSKAAQLSKQTLETYFALGALFRRKGDFDRAIRLHRNILLHPGLTPDVQRRARMALALDYRRSGLRDQARETLQKLVADEPENREASEEYRSLLEDAGDWAAAIEVQSRIVKSEGKGVELLAHLLAAAARSALSGDVAEAEQLARRAVELAANSADAHLALGEVRLHQRADDAAAELMAAGELEPELAPRLVALLAPAVPSAQVEAFLKAQIERLGERGWPYELALALLHREAGSREEALLAMRRVVERNPQASDARRELGKLLLAEGSSEDLRADYRRIIESIHEPTLGFACDRCVQKLPEHVFRCPSCGQWDTVRREVPRR